MAELDYGIIDQQKKVWDAYFKENTSEDGEIEEDTYEIDCENLASHEVDLLAWHKKLLNVVEIEKPSEEYRAHKQKQVDVLSKEYNAIVAAQDPVKLQYKFAEWYENIFADKKQLSEKRDSDLAAVQSSWDSFAHTLPFEDKDVERLEQYEKDSAADYEKADEQWKNVIEENEERSAKFKSETQQLELKVLDRPSMDIALCQEKLSEYKVQISAADKRSNEIISLRESLLSKCEVPLSEVRTWYMKASSELKDIEMQVKINQERVDQESKSCCSFTFDEKCEQCQTNSNICQKEREERVQEAVSKLDDSKSQYDELVNKLNQEFVQLINDKEKKDIEFSMIEDFLVEVEAAQKENELLRVELENLTHQQNIHEFEKSKIDTCIEKHNEAKTAETRISELKSVYQEHVDHFLKMKSEADERDKQYNNCFVALEIARTTYKDKQRALNDLDEEMQVLEETVKDKCEEMTIDYLEVDKILQDYLKSNTQYELESKQAKLKLAQNELNEINCKFINYKIAQEQLEHNMEIQKEIDELVAIIDALKKKIAISKERADKMKEYEMWQSKKDNIVSRKLAAQDRLNQVQESKKNMEINEAIKIKIGELKAKHQVCDSELQEVDKELNALVGDRDALQKTHERLNNIESDIADTKDATKCLEFYKNSMDEDGIRKSIIENTMEILIYQTNQLLNNIVDFRLSFEMNKDSLNIFIDDGHGNARDVALSSGFESFVIDLALRVGFQSICQSGAMSDMCVVDEGWSSISSTNMDNIRRVLDVIATRYKWIAMITHVDILKTFVTSEISIQKNNDNVSCLRYGKRL